MGRRKTDEREWREQLLKLLPEEACREVVTFAKGLKEIQPPKIIYHRESVPETDLYLQTCGLGGIEEDKYHWGAECLCTACMEKFYAGWDKGGIILLTGDDGMIYPGWTDGKDEMSTLIPEGESLPCPCCGEEVETMRRSKIRGRQYTTQIAELTNIGDTTCLLYWLATFYLEKDGYYWGGIRPRMAVAVSPEGRISRFTHTSFGVGSEWNALKWQPVTQFKDPEQMPFNEGGGMWRGTVGAYWISTADDMKDKTGEKTGIEAYFEGDRTNAAAYLKLWEKYPNVENLVNTGTAPIVHGIVRNCLQPGPQGGTENGTVAMGNATLSGSPDLLEAKPHKALRVTKPEYRLIAQRRWTLHALRLFNLYRDKHPQATAMEFEELENLFGGRDLETLAPVYGDNLHRIFGYISKQEDYCDMHNPVRYYVDYRNMLSRMRKEAAVRRPLTDEERFPRFLTEAHDRVNEALGAIDREHRRRGGTEEQFQTFEKLKTKLAALEWKNGEYCIVIPASPEELVQEGEVLHHCVGGYASEHCSGKMIFFVRHARRPERSWFTLNEDMNGSTVRRIQLHGYRNEWAHGKRLTIPKEVTDFVQCWEKEVLAPYLKNKGRISV